MPKKDITDKDIDRAMKAFGEQVKALSAARQDFVMAKLEQEMARLRPHATRLLNGPGEQSVVGVALNNKPAKRM